MDVDQRRQLYEDIYRRRKEKEEEGGISLDELLNRRF